MYSGLDSEEIIISDDNEPKISKKKKVLPNLKVDIIKPPIEIPIINLAHLENDQFNLNTEIHKAPAEVVHRLVIPQTTIPAITTQSAETTVLKSEATISQTLVPTIFTSQTTIPSIITSQTTIPSSITSQTTIPSTITSQAAIPTAITPQDNIQNIKKNTPKSGTHVRVLDFNFGTQNKDTTEKEQDKKSNKCLFGKLEGNEKNKTSEKTIPQDNKDPLKSWDADLRASFAPPVINPPKGKSKKSKSKKASKKEPPKESKKDKVNTKKDDNTVKKDKSLEETKVNVEIQKKKTKNVTTRRARITAKQVLSPSKIQNKRKMAIKENNLKIESEKNDVKNIKGKDINVKDNKVKEIEVKEIEVKKNEEADLKENVIQNLQFLKGTQEIEISETLNLRNLNKKPKYPRKCNIGNNVKKDIKIITVKEIRPIELVNEVTNKLVLSPSKLNANKRTFVEAEQSIETNKKIPDIDPPVVPEISETANILNSKPIAVENDFESSFNKLITPEITKLDSSQPISANCNITPFLETPMKFIEGGLPKTPGIFSPLNTVDTPITKTLKKSMQGVDLSAIKTPQFPVTPDIPITPYIEGEFPSRSTDYSTSSSYYQPSDTEQNKCLEQFIIDECNRPGSAPKKSRIETKGKIIDVDNKTEKAIAEKMLTMNKNMIAKKNLNLVKQHAEIQDTLEFTESSCSNSSCSCSSSISPEIVNGTVIEKHNNSSTRYALRSQKNNTSFSECDLKSVTPKKISEILKNENERRRTRSIILTETEEASKEIIMDNKSEKKTITSAQQKLLTEMAEKRKRVINQLEGDTKSKPTRNPPRRKEPPIPSTRNVPSRSCKAIAAKSKETVRQRSPSKKNKSLEELHKNQSICPLAVMEAETLRASSSTPLFSESKQNLESHPLKNFHKAFETFTNKSENQHEIEDKEDIIVALKRRGIHLMPNKTPVKDEENLNGSSRSKKSKKSILNKLLKNEERIISDKKLEVVQNKPQPTQPTDEIFDIKTNEDYIIVIHDEKKKPERRLSDYNFDLIKKGISALLYVDDKEIEKTMVPTNLEILFDLPETSKRKKGKKKFSPLNVLYDDLVDSTKEIFTQQIISPLENLYEEKKKDYKKNSQGKNRISKQSTKICDKVHATEEQLEQCASDTEVIKHQISKTDECQR